MSAKYKVGDLVRTSIGMSAVVERVISRGVVRVRIGNGLVELHARELRHEPLETREEQDAERLSTLTLSLGPEIEE